MAKKLTFNEISKVVTDKGYFLLGDNENDVVFANGKWFVYLIDDNGYKYYSRYEHVKDGTKIRFVGGSNPYSLENISLWLKLNNKTFELCEDSKYLNSRNKINFYCHVCTNIFQNNWGNISQNQSCGICSGQAVGKTTSLSYLMPDLAKEWSGENKLGPNKYTLRSNEKVWWICKDCGHNFEMVISKRTSRFQGCPMCSGSIVSDKNRLSTLYPELCEEWNYNKNGDLRPENLSYGSNKKVWWICKDCEREWLAVINSRTSGRGCSKCSSIQTQSKIATQLKEYFENNYNAIPEYKIFRNPETKCYLPFDIYLPNENIFIEVHGSQHYNIKNGWVKKLAIKNKRSIEEEFKYRQSISRIKKEYAEQNGFYIEIDLRKIKTFEDALNYIFNLL